MHAHSASQSLLCNPMNCSPPDSSVHGILQARILEWALLDPGIRLTSLASPALAGSVFTTSATWAAQQSPNCP